MVLQPKGVLPLHVAVGGVEVREGLGIIDDFILIFIEGTSFFLDLTGKPIVPTLKTVVRSRLITNIFIVIDPLECFRAQPSSFLSIHMLQRLGRVQHTSVSVENLFKVLIHLGNSEEKSSLVCI